MAGAGYKLFNSGDVLTAAQVNTYLQEQAVMRFANAAARTTALSGVLAEGMMSYLDDTNAVEVYNGSAWVSISADQTPLTTKGDLFTYSTTDARLGVGSNGETLVADSSTTTGLRWQAQYAAGKNYVINGNMAIDQRNSGNAVTINTAANTFSVDRFTGWGNASDGVYTLQRDTTAPAGFANSLKVTVTTADASISASQTYFLQHLIEGTSVGELNFGSANAATVTLSFWVRSSVTGTFSGAIQNSASNRSYPYTYSISSANTWERKSITIAGDTSGTWLSTTGIGLRLQWSLGSGSNFLATAGAWASGNYVGATGETAIIGTLNATLYITGIQLERGSVATPFTTATGTIAGELAACQRYYWRAGGSELYETVSELGIGTSTTQAYVEVSLPQMRVRPTAVEYSTLELVIPATATYAISAITLAGTESGRSKIMISVTTTGITQYRAYMVRTANSLSGYLAFTAEL